MRQLASVRALRAGEEKIWIYLLVYIKERLPLHPNVSSETFFFRWFSTVKCDAPQPQLPAVLGKQVHYYGDSVGNCIIFICWIYQLSNSLSRVEVAASHARRANAGVAVTEGLNFAIRQPMKIFLA